MAPDSSRYVRRRSLVIAAKTASNVQSNFYMSALIYLYTRLNRDYAGVYQFKSEAIKGVYNDELDTDFVTFGSTGQRALQNIHTHKMKKIIQFCDDNAIALSSMAQMVFELENSNTGRYLSIFRNETKNLIFLFLWAHGYEKPSFSANSVTHFYNGETIPEVVAKKSQPAITIH